MKKHLIITGILVMVLLSLIFIPKQKNLETIKSDLNVITIEVTGAIQKPGFYTLIEGDLLINLLEKAGGFLVNADRTNINYFEKITQKSYHFPFLKDMEIIHQMTYNLNTITFQELITLPHITETRAINILIYRGTAKVFYSIDELLNVKGIGDVTFNQIKDYFYI